MARYAAEAGRYQLWVAWVCPWAGRTLAVRALKGLEGVVDVNYALPGLGSQGWVYEQGPDGERPVGGYPLHKLYVEHDKTFTGKVTVPTLWDRKTRRIVNNESAEIIRMLNSAFDDLTGNALDLYPAALRADIERWNDLIYATLNNGVYRAGFAGSQEAYEEAAHGVFDTLERMEQHLTVQRYLAGEYCTEADWRAFVTLVRFDTAYHGAFRCNLRRIEDYPALSGYLRELYQWPGIAQTVRLDAIKRGYYELVDRHRIVAIGPALDLERPHGREGLPGRGIWTNGN
ncbi:MAG: glutathione S-transferase C-terminal domain-containing protein [Gammaproteobacteria bacterium]|nr:glutathione S-transferase C-terminal domain-containing protein [Gammaproteobacteria bacterium]